MNQNNLIEEIVSILKKREKQEVFAKIEKFCTERLDNLRKNITPMSPFKEGSKTVLHLIPLDSVLNPKNYDLFANASNRALLMPMQAGSFEGHYNIHGMLNLSIIENAENPPSIPGYLKYVQAFTNGTIEAVDGAFRSNGLNIIARELEETIISSASDYLKFQAGLKIEPPILLCLALLGTKGCLISPRSVITRYTGIHAVREEDLIFPKIILENLEIEYGHLKSTFDYLWRACGYPHCLD